MNFRLLLIAFVATTFTLLTADAARFSPNPRQVSSSQPAPKDATDYLLNIFSRMLSTAVDSDLSLDASLSEWLRWLTLQVLRPLGLVERIPLGNSVDRLDTGTTEEVLVVPLLGTHVRFGDMIRMERIAYEALDAVKLWQRKARVDRVRRETPEDESAEPETEEDKKEEEAEAEL